jgi:surface antigen
MQSPKEKLSSLLSISSQFLSKLPVWMTLSVLSQVAIAPLLILEAGSMGKAEAISQNQPTVRSCRDIDMKLNMTANRALAKGKFVMNTCGYALRFQTDGNLVLTNKSGQALWATGSEGKASNLLMRKDGNLVMYAGHHSKLWETGTTRNPGAFMSLQGDGNLVIYSRDRKKALWATGTNGGQARTRSAAAEWGIARAKKIADEIAERKRAAEEIAAKEMAAKKAAEASIARVDQSAYNRESQRKINSFVNEFNGKTNIQRYDTSEYGGQCVTLVIRYLQDHYGAPRTPFGLGNGKDVAAGAANEFPGSFLPLNDPSDPIPGSIISFQSEPYGHVALVVNSRREGNTLFMTILESNGDLRAEQGDSLVRTKNITVDAKTFASSYVGQAFWVNPRD